MSDNDLLDDHVELLKIMGHPLRLKIIKLIAHKEYSVGDIDSLTDITQPTLSQQLAILRSADLVKTRRDAKQIYYRLKNNRLETLCTLINHLGDVRDNEQQQPSGNLRSQKLGNGSAFARVL